MVRRARNAAAELVPSLAPSPGDSHATRGAKRRDSGVRARRTNRRSPSHSGTTTRSTTSGTAFSGTTTTAADVWKRRGLAAGYDSRSFRFVRIVSRDGRRATRRRRVNRRGRVSALRPGRRLVQGGRPGPQGRPPRSAVGEPRLVPVKLGSRGAVGDGGGEDPRRDRPGNLRIDPVVADTKNAHVERRAARFARAGAVQAASPGAR